MFDRRRFHLRRRESAVRRGWEKVVRIAADIAVARLIARRLWRHRPPVLGR